MPELGFRIEASSKAFEILANNLYKDKILAVVRELSCNAFDAHVEAGKTHVPFEVSLPTSTTDQFRVRDFGKGLDNSQVEEIFTVFFASTKVGSSAYTGAFGLGAKTPFAIVNEFNVNSYQNGHVTKYLCHKKDGLPVIVLIGVEPTTLEDGLEISFSVANHKSDWATWHSKACLVFDAFKVKPNLNVNTNQVWYSCDLENYQSGEFWETLPNVRGTIVVQMGNVRYDVDIHMLPKIQSRYKSVLSYMWNYNGLCLHIPGKSIEITPSREEISYDPNTVEYLQDTISGFFTRYEKQIISKLNSAESYFDALDFIIHESQKNCKNLMFCAIPLAKLQYKNKSLLIDKNLINLDVKIPDAEGQDAVIGEMFLLEYDAGNDKFKTVSVDNLSGSKNHIQLNRYHDSVKLIFLRKDTVCRNPIAVRIAARDCLATCKNYKLFQVICVEEKYYDQFLKHTGMRQEKIKKLSECVVPTKTKKASIKKVVSSESKIIVKMIQWEIDKKSKQLKPVCQTHSFDFDKHDVIEEIKKLNDNEEELFYVTSRCHLDKVPKSCVTDSICNVFFGTADGTECTLGSFQNQVFNGQLKKIFLFKENSGTYEFLENLRDDCKVTNVYDKAQEILINAYNSSCFPEIVKCLVFEELFCTHSISFYKDTNDPENIEGLLNFYIPYKTRAMSHNALTDNQEIITKFDSSSLLTYNIFTGADKLSSYDVYKEFNICMIANFGYDFKQMANLCKKYKSVIRCFQDFRLYSTILNCVQIKFNKELLNKHFNDVSLQKLKNAILSLFQQFHVVLENDFSEEIYYKCVADLITRGIINISELDKHVVK